MVCLSDFDLQKPRTGSISGPFLGWHDFNIFFLPIPQVGIEVNMIVDNLPVACSVAAGSGPCVAEHFWAVVTEAATKYIRRSDGNDYMCPL
jgi:hypothetical protein